MVLPEQVALVESQVLVVFRGNLAILDLAVTQGSVELAPRASQVFLVAEAVADFLVSRDPEFPVIQASRARARRGSAVSLE